MSTHITGKLILAGDYTEDEQLDPELPLARVVIVMPKNTLRDVSSLPMFQEVTVIKTTDLTALRAANAALLEDKERLDFVLKLGAAKSVRMGARIQEDQAMKIRDIPIGATFRYHGRDFTVTAFERGTSPTGSLVTCESDHGIFGIAEHTFCGEIECETVTATNPRAS